MKGRSHPTNDVTLNPSRSNESIHDVIGRVDANRRKFIKTGLSASTLAAMGGVSSFGLLETVEAAPIPAANGFAGIGFESVPAKVQMAVPPLTGPKFSDTIDIPAGYTSKLLVAWGDPVAPGAPAWAEDATQNAAAQEKQYGMHNDGMHYFPFALRGVPGGSSERGLLCVNHEYTHENILHGAEGLTGGAGVTIQKVRKSQAAHGVSVMEVRKTGSSWAVISSSAYGRRITANTPMRISGPAAGAALLKSTRFVISDTASTPNGVGDGIASNGTANNCAHGWTPWGTYLACEENWNGYFGTAGTAPGIATENGKNNNRYGVVAAGFGY
ncbi:MAG: twin-arginine translocation pathway signal protein, partial [Burkholderiales bacterium 12-64-5]